MLLFKKKSNNLNDCRPMVKKIPYTAVLPQKRLTSKADYFINCPLIFFSFSILDRFSHKHRGDVCTCINENPLRSSVDYFHEEKYILKGTIEY